MWKHSRYVHRKKSRRFRNGAILMVVGVLTVANFLLPEFGKEQFLDIALTDKYAIPLYVAGYFLIFIGLMIIGVGLRSR